MNSSFSSAFAEDYRIAVLYEQGLGGGPRAEYIVNELRKEGFQISVGAVSDVANPATFNVLNFEALLLPNAAVFPVSATENLMSFMKQGGDVILLGGEAFHVPVDWADGRFEPAEKAVAFAAEQATRTPLFDLSKGDKERPITWRNNTDSKQRKSQLNPIPGQEGVAIRIDIRELNHFDTFSANLVSPISDENNLLFFVAKSNSENTAEMAVELRKEDESRWIATVELGTEWRNFGLRASDFVLHHGGNRNKTPSFQLQNAAKISFGLTRDYTQVEGSDHTLWIKDLSVGRIELQDIQALQELPIYTDLPPFQYSEAPHALVLLEGEWTGPKSIPGPISGTAAFAVPRAGASQLFPILQVDGKIAPITVASVLAHYDREFMNSQWLLFGPENPEFYEQAGFIDLLSHTLLLMKSNAYLEQARSTNPLDKDLKQVLGITHVDGMYHFTETDFLNEGVQVISELGTRTIKLWFADAAEKYSFNSNWPEVTSMTELASTPYFRKAFNAPFDIYYLEAFAVQPSWKPLFRNGLTPEQAAVIEKEFYDLTVHFLTEYKGTGKTFVLQNWEGDWGLRPKMDRSLAPRPKAIQGMIDWLVTRQNGVNRAREEIGEEGVKVLHAAEMNLVLESIKGKPGVVNKVIPFTNVDLVSYSCYETQGDPEAFRAALEYMQMNLPPSTHVKGNRVVIGEFGVAETLRGEATSRRLLPQVIEIATAFGSPHLLFWELYCNEPIRQPVVRNEDVNGFWLIKPDGTKAWAWSYFEALLRP